ncbi:hypothetical protein HBI56_114300 [Parastagonospora nodorum]|uniref:Uncharacterized protein n=1 Tax=Phaeosphaeria nodorum (strain SN15 / ATCC MYA-4574 / FGSC 10173) TaxID=321614 RepID=A0A7U2I5E9_PHANO|nr:hypothetical protein HBH56_195150 [Parastagonospora nodorum]QRD00517.1 hypothetical protein JI435_415290 [Parastagonospora nodorum SN15]KAH3924933.1 hypothetical protein HBH54_188340 [Parastagonospora nodorum]KAH3952890.1 hypothetical protein HBH53_040490 [Parastagonospora nodorum]KAH3976220.1 hypothetical protein HBH52_118000 [Parastagonospora nodorum]
MWIRCVSAAFRKVKSSCVTFSLTYHTLSWSILTSYSIFHHVESHTEDKILFSFYRDCYFCHSSCPFG